MQEFVVSNYFSSDLVKKVINLCFNFITFVSLVEMLPETLDKIVDFIDARLEDKGEE